MKKAITKKPVKKVIKKAIAEKPVKKVVKKAVKPVVKKAAKAIKKAAPKKLSKPVKKAVKAVRPVKKTAAAKKPVIKLLIKKPAMPAPAKAGELLTAAELKEVKQHLIEMRDDALTRIKEQKEDMPEAEVGDPIDTASQSLDKEILFELSDNSQMLVDQIEAALRKIDKGIYGRCESCRIILPKKRIKALPFARYCVHCQSSNESRR